MPLGKLQAIAINVLPTVKLFLDFLECVLADITKGLVQVYEGGRKVVIVFHALLIQQI
jgi:hypothetical protein